MARILLVRHGDAAYEADVINDEGGCLTPLGREQSRDLGDRLADEGVVRIWTSPMSRAVQTAEIAAATLGLDAVTVREDLPDAPPDDGTAARTAVVVTHGGAIGAVVTHVVRDLPHLFARRRHLPNCEAVELVREGGTWRMARWGSNG